MGDALHSRQPIHRGNPHQATFIEAPGRAAAT
jgi:hypothetical protein